MSNSIPIVKVAQKSIFHIYVTNFFDCPLNLTQVSLYTLCRLVWLLDLWLDKSCKDILSFQDAALIIRYLPRLQIQFLCTVRIASSRM